MKNSVFINSNKDITKYIQFGGAVCWIGNDGTLTQSTFTNFYAKKYGAAVYWRGQNGKLSYCIFENNTSPNDFAYLGNPDYANSNYWGMNINSTQDFVNEKLIYSTDSYKAPQNWVNIEATIDSVDFVLNSHEKPNDCLPTYQININGTDYTLINNTHTLRNETTIICDDLVTYSLYDGKYLKITLKSGDVNLPSKKLQININGKTIDKFTNNNGIVEYKINFKDSGVYKVAVTFDGDDKYRPFTKTSKITVKKQKTSLALKTSTIKSKAKKKTVTFVLKEQFKKAISKKTVKLTINKKTYTSKTNSKGLVSFKVILKSKKKYAFSAKFNGDKSYNSVLKKGKINVK